MGKIKLLEICVDSLESAKIAEEAGADRLEICKDLSVGGLTPSPEFIREIKENVSIPVHVLIRPRPELYRYTDSEIQKMVSDIKMIKSLGVDGLVLGAMHEYYRCVQYTACSIFMEAAGDLPVTFHRGFDIVSDKSEALEALIFLGFKRILTTGGPDNARSGAISLKQLIDQAESRIIVMPGGDVSDNNLNFLAEVTQGEEFHSSGRKIVNEETKEKSILCDRAVIREMKKILLLHSGVSGVKIFT